MFVVYVLYSSQYDKIYIGQTSSLISRFHSHNSLATKGWTVRFRPWQVVHVEFFGTRANALMREKELKSGQGRAWIRHNKTAIF